MDGERRAAPRRRRATAAAIAVVLVGAVLAAAFAAGQWRRAPGGAGAAAGTDDVAAAAAPAHPAAPSPAADASVAVPGRTWALADDPAAWFSVGAAGEAGARPLRGDDGCNALFGEDARVTADTLDLGPAGSTRRFCAEHREAQDLFAALAAAGPLPVRVDPGADPARIGVRAPGGAWAWFVDAGPAGPAGPDGGGAAAPAGGAGADVGAGRPGGGADHAG